MAENICWANPELAANSTDWRTHCDPAVVAAAPAPHAPSLARPGTWRTRDPELVNSRLLTVGRAARLTRYHVRRASAAKRQHRALRSTVIAIPMPPARFIGTPTSKLRGRATGCSTPARQCLVAIIQVEEQLAEVAAMASMASGYVGRRKWRRICLRERGHQLRGERETRFGAIERRQSRRCVRRNEQAGPCKTSPRLK